jgi:hypothetical protein
VLQVKLSRAHRAARSSRASPRHTGLDAYFAVDVRRCNFFTSLLDVGIYWTRSATEKGLPNLFSSAFLTSYIVNHALHGDTLFPGHGPVRTLYLSILGSHVILSIIALPMVLTTFFFSLTGRFAMHRRIARLTFPIWLYVSITGVVVFFFLKAYVSIRRRADSCVYAISMVV